MKKILVALIIVLTMGLDSNVSAALISFELKFAGSFDNPTVRLKNTSEATVQLTDFSMTIGDTSREFDMITNPISDTDPGGDLTSTLVIGDSNQDLIGTDLYKFSFTGFNSNDLIRFYTEIDEDAQNTSEDYRMVFFNNGENENSVVTVSFFDGLNPGTLTMTLPDGDVAESYVFIAEGQTVPIPGALWLFGSGLIGVIVLKKRKV